MIELGLEYNIGWYKYPCSLLLHCAASRSMEYFPLLKKIPKRSSEKDFQWGDESLFHYETVGILSWPISTTFKFSVARSLLMKISKRCPFSIYFAAICWALVTTLQIHSVYKWYVPHRVVQKTTRMIIGGDPGVSGLLSSVERLGFKS